MRVLPSRAAFAAAALVALAALGTGCAPQGAESTQVEGVVTSSNPELATDPDVPVVSDLIYAAPAGEPLLLDACLPPDFDPQSEPARAAIVVVHGGSWARGSKNDIAWRAVCQWLAKSGYPSFNVDYRLAPAHPFPAAIDDVSAAVSWLREPAQQERFGIDPDRIGAFGGSAGGNLVSLLGTRGRGAHDVGSRVAAVVELSAPIDLSGVDATDDFIPVQLSYLGCAEVTACTAAITGSPGTWIDASDPPFFIAHSTDEMIPLAQAETFVTQLRGFGVDTTFVTVTGTLHSIAMIDKALKQRILDFYASALAPRELPREAPDAAR